MEISKCAQQGDPAPAVLGHLQLPLQQPGRLLPVLLVQGHTGEGPQGAQVLGVQLQHGLEEGNGLLAALQLQGAHTCRVLRLLEQLLAGARDFIAEHRLQVAEGLPPALCPVAVQSQGDAQHPVLWIPPLRLQQEGVGVVAPLELLIDPPQPVVYGAGFVAAGQPPQGVLQHGAGRIQHLVAHHQLGPGFQSGQKIRR